MRKTTHDSGIGTIRTGNFRNSLGMHIPNQELRWAQEMYSNVNIRAWNVLRSHVESNRIRISQRIHTILLKSILLGLHFAIYQFSVNYKNATQQKSISCYQSYPNPETHKTQTSRFTEKHTWQFCSFFVCRTGCRMDFLRRLLWRNSGKESQELHISISNANFRKITHWQNQHF